MYNENIGALNYPIKHYIGENWQHERKDIGYKLPQNIIRLIKNQLQCVLKRNMK